MQPARTPTTAALLAAATALDHGLFLAWDQVKDRDPVTGGLTGPYGAWQVAGCLLVLLALGLWAARQRQPLVVFTVPLVFTLCWAGDAATDPEEPSLWPIGAWFVALGTSLGAGACLLLAPLVAALLSRPAREQWAESLWRRTGRRWPVRVVGVTLLGATAGLVAGALPGLALVGAGVGALVTGGGSALLALGRSVVRRDRRAAAGTGDAG